MLRARAGASRSGDAAAAAAGGGADQRARASSCARSTRAKRPRSGSAAGAGWRSSAVDPARPRQRRARGGGRAAGPGRPAGRRWRASRRCRRASRAATHATLVIQRGPNRFAPVRPGRLRGRPRDGMIIDWLSDEDDVHEGFRTVSKVPAPGALSRARAWLLEAAPDALVSFDSWTSLACICESGWLAPLRRPSTARRRASPGGGCGCWRRGRSRTRRSRRCAPATARSTSAAGARRCPATERRRSGAPTSVTTRSTAAF